ncbi:hypothetical protein [Streptomyces noursei]|uniref:hypothetical protein n=1 Tax=Streptomyces noursei TaxID=1971 RepID=UPI0019CEC28E|nr:hypothetical protein [Streptomyces noursei]MCZ1019904.1 hypothetical protein [Streptomyces noursei]GGX34267.1 hypothetical protein GCM10010341_64710 [Streptomyces noursei]
MTPEPNHGPRPKPTPPPFPTVPTLATAPAAAMPPRGPAHPVPAGPHGPEPPGGPPAALARFDALCARPFPERREHTATGTSGPGFHVARLWASGPLWDVDPADAAAAREQCVEELAALVALVSVRRGGPVVHDLAEALERSAMGLPVPPPLELLSALMPRVYAWPDGGRWIAVGAGRPEFGQPCQVVGVIAKGPLPGGG